MGHGLPGTTGAGRGSGTAGDDRSGPWVTDCRGRQERAVGHGLPGTTGAGRGSRTAVDDRRGPWVTDCRGRQERAVGHGLPGTTGAGRGSRTAGQVEIPLRAALTWPSDDSRLCHIGARMGGPGEALHEDKGLLLVTGFWRALEVLYRLACTPYNTTQPDVCDNVIPRP